MRRLADEGRWNDAADDLKKTQALLITEHGKSQALASRMMRVRNVTTRILSRFAIYGKRQNTTVVRQPVAATALRQIPALDVPGIYYGTICARNCRAMMLCAVMSVQEHPVRPEVRSQACQNPILRHTAPGNHLSVRT